MNGVNLVPHDCNTAPFSVHCGHGAKKYLSVFVCWCVYIYKYICKYACTICVLYIYIYVYIYYINICIYIYMDGVNLVPHDCKTAPFSVH